MAVASGTMPSSFNIHTITMKNTLLFIIAFTCAVAQVSADNKLTGTVIGASNDTESCQLAFDGDLSTFFAAADSSYAWVGLDLGEPHVITRIGWSPCNDDKGGERMVLGLFEGANKEDFMDALPLYIITDQGITGTMSHADVSCSRGFRYVRYVGPSAACCNVAELEFYGHAGEGDNTGLYRLTNQPTLTIHTSDGVIPYEKETYITAMFTLIDEDGATVLSEPGKIRERGNSSRTFPKRPYNIKFDEKQQISVSSAKAKNWYLVANYTDKTLLRNLLALEISRRFQMAFTPYAQTVDVLLNGEYKGAYLITDALKVENGRIELDEMTSDDNSGEALTGGYLLEVDAHADEEISWFTSSSGIPVTIHYPADDEITSQQHAYIEEAFNKMESDWETYLDMNTFLRHFLINELAGNIDIYWSVYMYKHRSDDIFYTGPVWDFDFAFENSKFIYPTNASSDFLYRSGGHSAGTMKDFADKIIIENESAREQLIQIWSELRQTSITEQQFMDYIDAQVADLEQTKDLNFMRWPILNEAIDIGSLVWGSYEAEVENVRRYLSERIAWLDSKLGYSENTGIDSLDLTDSTAKTVTWYSLSGLRLNGKPSAPGIYIKNGRKFVVK